MSNFGEQPKFNMDIPGFHHFIRYSLCSNNNGTRSFKVSNVNLKLITSEIVENCDQSQRA